MRVMSYKKNNALMQTYKIIFQKVYTFILMHELFVRKGTKAQQPPGSRIKLDAYF